MTDRVDLRDTGRPRLPPGQIITRKWPVLHYGTVPAVDLGDLALRGQRRGRAPARRSPGTSCRRCPGGRPSCDIHCVTRWSRYDNVFEGVPVQALLERAGVRPDGRVRPGPRGAGATRPTCRWRTSTGRPTCWRSRTTASRCTPEHGGPVRLLVPHLYFWKSAKWVTGFELLEEDYPGFWEQNGYHMRGDPWREERYGRPDPVRMRRGPQVTSVAASACLFGAQPGFPV